MKYYLKSIILLILILCISYNKAFCFTKIAIINLAKIFQIIPQKEKIFQELKKENNQEIRKIQKMKISLKNKIKKLKNKNLSKKVKQKIEKEITYQKNLLFKKIINFKINNNKREKKARNKILLFINKLINIVAEKGHYNIIIDISFISYVKNVKDITNDVIELANTQANILFTI
ncbi:hypothetical protein GJT89_01095 [Enterobacteriaceae endosymbiont of Donacia versicolorea]|uniref:OmpH family outer membrane protein n=1 Tax=Enterobacteriaceae endosymbiont of Donacia versicolorea TaxID=2675788 RepID=UPI0014490F57|nr:OmpH family outer membrane protein [Enterobacteriaceae endosymbiont of Donacia versicolorea]QJC32086.1 hypothetical protein GJT89_01095 [Enterobacteriaceae endosymbiont of Donacia versicolorea]